MNVPTRAAVLVLALTHLTACYQSEEVGTDGPVEADAGRVADRVANGLRRVVRVSSQPELTFGIEERQRHRN